MNAHSAEGSIRDTHKHINSPAWAPSCMVGFSLASVPQMLIVLTRPNGPVIEINEFGRKVAYSRGSDLFY